MTLVKCRSTRADQWGMPTAFTREVVSPELALVDAELASRALIVPPAPSGTVHALATGAERGALASPAQLPAGRGALLLRRIVPVLALMTMAAGSMLGSGVLGAGWADGESSRADALAWVVPGHSAVSPVAGARRTPADGRTETTSSRRVVADAAQAGGDRTQTTRPVRGQRAAQEQPTTQSVTRFRSGEAPGLGVPSRAVTLLWRRVASASSYHIELVRGRSQIFVTTSRSPQVTVPRSWRRGGMMFEIRPEDQAYVWPIIDGRRAARPVVNGAMALDLTLPANFTGRRGRTQ